VQQAAEVGICLPAGINVARSGSLLGLRCGILTSHRRCCISCTRSRRGQLCRLHVLIRAIGEVLQPAYEGGGGGGGEGGSAGRSRATTIGQGRHERVARRAAQLQRRAADGDGAAVNRHAAVHA
jgi:hypothetical protein